MQRKWIAAALFGSAASAVALTAWSPALAGSNGKEQHGEGKYAELSADWWKWVYSQPAVDVGGTNTNPVLDGTGAYGAAGQTNGIGPGNKYFFLAGTFGGTTTRSVTVPAGKELFFPVLNLEMDNAVDPVTDYSVPELRALAKASIDTKTVAWAKVDGASIEVFRTKSPTFSYTLPAADSIYAYFGLTGSQFQGTVKPAVSDGYWAYSPALSAGTHTVQFHGENSGGFSVDVTYNLTVQ